MIVTDDSKQIALSEILNRISEGESVRSILSSDRDQDKLPSRAEFYEWVVSDKQIADQYTRAMELRTDLMADETLDIADEFGNDIITMPDGSKVENARIIARDRLRVDTRKWLMSKMHPKKYGDKISQDITSGGEKITQIIKWGDKEIIL